jgi:very-short-patch-repair endonuclease
MREMNEIERMFYDAFMEQELSFAKQYHLKVKLSLYPQYSYGGYILDFVYKVEDSKELCFDFCIEIDGQESHKTKNQRLNDYQRERYLQAHGFHVIRFTASEVFVNAHECVSECRTIIALIIQGYKKYHNVCKKYHDMALEDLKRGL